MARSRGNAWRWLALGLGAVVLWQVGGFVLEQRGRPDRLVNQLWIERMPTGPRDMVWQFVAVEHKDRHFGALGRVSHWRIFLDRFLWKQEGDRFVVVTPQNDCKLSLAVRTWKCAGQAPKPFELCLELESGGKKYRYFSREDWVVRPGGTLTDAASLGQPAVQTALGGPAPGPIATGAADAEHLAVCPTLGPE